jgi:hypothetical protein
MPDETAGQTGGLAKIAQMLSGLVGPKASTASPPVPGLMDAKVKANEIPTESSGNLPPGLLNQLMKDPRFVQYLNMMKAKSGMAQQQYDASKSQPNKDPNQPIGPAEQENSSKSQKMLEAINRMKQGQSSP